MGIPQLYHAKALISQREKSSREGLALSKVWKGRRFMAQYPAVTQDARKVLEPLYQPHLSFQIRPLNIYGVRYHAWEQDARATKG